MFLCVCETKGAGNVAEWGNRLVDQYAMMMKHMVLFDQLFLKDVSIVLPGEDANVADEGDAPIWKYFVDTHSAAQEFTTKVGLGVICSAIQLIQLFPLFLCVSPSPLFLKDVSTCSFMFRVRRSRSTSCWCGTMRSGP